MRTALQANNDAEMIRVLQVGRDEMPEAIKMLQRASEKEVERERAAAELEEVVIVPSISATATSSETAIPQHSVIEGATLRRSRTVLSQSSGHTSSSSAASTLAKSRAPRDTLDLAASSSRLASTHRGASRR